jgi:hypothetical protein
MPHYLLVATLLFGAQSVRPAEDFAFRFESLDCPLGLIDTFNGTYRRRIAGRVSGSPSDVSIPIVLNSDQRSEIFEAVITMGFFDLPPVFNPRMRNANENVLPGNRMLRVRNAGMDHTIWWTPRSWTPNPTPISEDERKRNAVMSTIFRVIEAHPLVQRLPAPMGGCE